MSLTSTRDWQYVCQPICCKWSNIFDYFYIFFILLGYLWIKGHNLTSYHYSWFYYNVLISCYFSLILYNILKGQRQIKLHAVKLLLSQKSGFSLSFIQSKKFLTLWTFPSYLSYQADNFREQSLVCYWIAISTSTNDVNNALFSP